jgi:hypothetical protein
MGARGGDDVFDVAQGELDEEVLFIDDVDPVEGDEDIFLNRIEIHHGSYIFFPLILAGYGLERPPLSSKGIYRSGLTVSSGTPDGIGYRFNTPSLVSSAP